MTLPYLFGRAISYNYIIIVKVKEIDDKYG